MKDSEGLSFGGGGGGSRPIFGCRWAVEGLKLSNKSGVNDAKSEWTRVDRASRNPITSSRFCASDAHLQTTELSTLSIRAFCWGFYAALDKIFIKTSN